MGVESLNKNVGTSLSGVTSPIDLIAVGVTTDPSKSGIETSSNGLKLYFYVGDVLQDPAPINASEVLSDIAKLKGADFDQIAKEKIVGWGMPDYSAGVALSPSTLTTITTKGWINYTSIRTNAIGGVTVSGVLFQSGSSATNDRGAMMIPVDVGDTVQGVSGGSDTVTFYPCKGV